MLAYDVRIAELEAELKRMIAEPTEVGRKESANRARAIVYLGDEKSASVSSIQDKRKRVTFAGRSNGRSLTDSLDLLALRMGRDWEIRRDYQYQQVNRPTMIEYSPEFWVNVEDGRLDKVGEWYAQVLPPTAVVSPAEYYGSFHGVKTSHTRMIEHALAPNRLADNVQ